MRYELSDYEWTAIKPMLPNKPRGAPIISLANHIAYSRSLVKTPFKGQCMLARESYLENPATCHLITSSRLPKLALFGHGAMSILSPLSGV